MQIYFQSDSLIHQTIEDFWQLTFENKGKIVSIVWSLLCISSTYTYPEVQIQIYGKKVTYPQMEKLFYQWN